MSALPAGRRLPHLMAMRALLPASVLLLALATPLGAQTPAASPPGPTAPESLPADAFRDAIRRAGELPALQTLLISVNGETRVDEGFRGSRTASAHNIKSASKSVVSALVGIAIDKGFIKGPDQPIADFLRADFPADADPRLATVTVGQLLSMQAGLERTSGANYGGWISSRNWVRDALRRPFVAEPGGRMLYSTGSTHLLSAILQRATKRSALDLSREWLGPAGVRVTDWERDPQGIYLGGNQMAMTPRSLLAFGELYRRGGVNAEGTRIVSESWIASSWTPRTTSAFHSGRYGYGWFIDRFAGHEVRYGWGYGGQMIYVVPDLDLTVAITSDESAPSARNGYVQELRRLLAEAIIPVVQRGAAAGG